MSAVKPTDKYYQQIFVFMTLSTTCTWKSQRMPTETKINNVKIDNKKKEKKKKRGNTK